MACGPERTAPTAPAGQAVWVWGLGPGPGRGGWGAAREHRALGLASQTLPGGRGEGAVWSRGASKLASSPRGALGLFSSYMGIPLGVLGEGERDVDLPPVPPPAPSACLRSRSR